MLTFTFKPRKLSSAIAYLAEQKPGLTNHRIGALLFLADKQHLLEFGRPITGDRYYALKHGPEPEHGATQIMAQLDQVGPVDLKPLSKSDLNVLDAILLKFGTYKEHAAWLRTPPNQRIEFELLFAGHPEAELVKSILQEEQGSLVSKGQ